MGKVNDFQCDFHWVIGPKNMTNILNGRYHRGEKGKHVVIQEWLRRKQEEAGRGS